MKARRQSLLWKLLLPVPLILLVTMLTAGILVPMVIAHNARDEAVREAEQTVKQFKALRSYYTENVVRKALASGALKPDIQHKNQPGNIPLPATMIHDMSTLLSEQDIQIQLYSLYPFPDRAERQLDAFQQQAWQALDDSPDAIFSRQVNNNGQEYVRVAIADRMVAEACVNCHNSHPASPKTDWKMGDVRGVLEVRKHIDRQLAAGQQLGNHILIAIFLSGILITLFLILLVRRHVLQPVISLTESTRAMAQGDLSARVSEEYDAEVKHLAQSYNQMADHLLEKERLESRHLKELEAAADIKEEVEHLSRYVEKVARGDLSSRLEITGNAELSGLARNLNSMTEGLAGITSDILFATDVINERVEQVEQALASQHDSAQRQASTVERSSSTLSQLVERSRWTVNQAEQLGKSAQRTQDQGQAGLNSVQSAITAAQDMGAQIDNVAETITSLATHTQQIGKITDAVRALAEQSKILAFNAAIESAKAGEAGKGFSAVSEEVRKLAEQSENATQEVKKLLEDIQGAMDQTIKATKDSHQRVDNSLGLIQDSGGAIQKLAEAIHDATLSSDQIVAAVQEETRGIIGVRTDISEFREDTQEMVNAADNALAASKELRQLTRNLRDKVSIYRIK